MFEGNNQRVWGEIFVNVYFKNEFLSISEPLSYISYLTTIKKDVGIS